MLPMTSFNISLASVLVTDRWIYVAKKMINSWIGWYINCRRHLTCCLSGNLESCPIIPQPLKNQRGSLYSAPTRNAATRDIPVESHMIAYIPSPPSIGPNAPPIRPKGGFQLMSYFMAVRNLRISRVIKSCCHRGRQAAYSQTNRRRKPTT
jgi:hypothetical protein